MYKVIIIYIKIKMHEGYVQFLEKYISRITSYLLLSIYYNEVEMMNMELNDDDDDEIGDGVDEDDVKLKADVVASGIEEKDTLV